MQRDLLLCLGRKGKEDREGLYQIRYYGVGDAVVRDVQEADGGEGVVELLEVGAGLRGGCEGRSMMKMEVKDMLVVAYDIPLAI